MKKFLNLFWVLGAVLVLTACSTGNGYISHEKFINIKEADGNGDLSFVTDDEYLIYFYATTCAHCINFKPTVKDYLEKEDALNIYAYNLDTESVLESAQRTAEIFKIDVQGTPTLAYVKDGVVVDILVGVQELDSIFVKGSYKNYGLFEETESTETELPVDEISEGGADEAVESNKNTTETSESVTSENNK